MAGNGNFAVEAGEFCNSSSFLIMLTGFLSETMQFSFI